MGHAAAVLTGSTTRTSQTLGLVVFDVSEGLYKFGWGIEASHSIYWLDDRTPR
jgi:hypothetical protein